MNCIIIEDDFLSQQTVIRYCKMFGEELNILGAFDSVESAEEYINNCEKRVDLIFVDVVLPGKNGIDFISDLFIVPYIILTTSHDSYAVKAFEMNVVDYLKKPFIYRRFFQAIHKVKKLIKMNEDKGSNETLILKSKGTLTRFLIKDIDYIESYSDYIKIFIKQDAFLHLIALRDIMKKLPSDKFVQIHRRFIVNIDKIISINENKIDLDGYEDLDLPISRAQRKIFYSHFLGE
jgi:DNA-binding LytR/AlgR family response regulator